MASELPNLIAAEFGDNPLITFKDPRLCRLFPIWSEALETANYHPLVLTPLRSPVEVAASLSKRDGFSEASGFLIWLRHVLEAEAASRHAPRHIFHWSDFLNDWRAELSLAMEQLGTSLPAWSDFTAETVDAFLDVKLRHAHHDRTLPAHAPEWIKATWDALDTLRRDPSSASAQETLDHIRIEFDSTAKIYGPALVGLEIESRNWLTRFHDETGTLKSEIDVVRNERDTQSTARAHVESLLHAATMKINDIEQQLSACQVENEKTLQLVQSELDSEKEKQKHAKENYKNLENQKIELEKIHADRTLEVEFLLQEIKNKEIEILINKENTTKLIDECNINHASVREENGILINTITELKDKLFIQDKKEIDLALLLHSSAEEIEKFKSDMQKLEKDLQAVQDAEANRLARNPLRRWL